MNGATTVMTPSIGQAVIEYVGLDSRSLCLLELVRMLLTFSTKEAERDEHHAEAQRNQYLASFWMMVSHWPESACSAIG